MSLAVSRVSVATDVDIPRRLARRESTKRVVRTRKVVVAKAAPNTEISNLSIVALAIVVGLGILGAFNLSNGMTPVSEIKLERAEKSSVPISLDSAFAVRKLGYLSISGNALNTSETRLSRIEAVVELLDSKQRILAVESSLIESETLPAGKTVPFQVELADSPKATSYRIRFRKMAGYEQ